MRRLVKCAIGAAILAICLCHPVSYKAAPNYSSEFESQVRSFVDNGTSRGVKVDISGLTIRQTDMFNDTPILAVCIPDDKTVLVNQKFWAGSDDTQKELVIWHELGHCVLGRDHNTYTHDGAPVSIMYPQAVLFNNEQYYYLHRQDYINELYKPFMSKLHEIDMQSPAGIEILKN